MEGPNDVGVGLSQLIPVIVSTLALDEGLLCLSNLSCTFIPPFRSVWATFSRRPFENELRDFAAKKGSGRIIPFTQICVPL